MRCHAAAQGCKEGARRGGAPAQVCERGLLARALRLEAAEDAGRVHRHVLERQVLRHVRIFRSHDAQRRSARDFLAVARLK
jgi:hypothetical protein